jgi:hypothetical protein
MAVNWIPQALLELAAFCRKWKTNLEDPANLTAFGWNQQEVAACLAAIDGFLTALETWQAVDSTLNKGLRDEAREKAVKAVELFANTSIRFNQSMSEAQRLDLFGVVTRHPGSSIPAPTTVPELSAGPGHIRQIVLEYRDQGSAKRGKPPKVHGIEIRWAILDHPPTGVELLANSAFDTRHPFTISFGEEDRGKTVYFAGRWEISREGEKGDFSAIVAAVIP